MGTPVYHFAMKSSFTSSGWPRGWDAGCDCGIAPAGARVRGPNRQPHRRAICRPPATRARGLRDVRSPRAQRVRTGKCAGTRAETPGCAPDTDRGLPPERRHMYEYIWLVINL